MPAPSPEPSTPRPTTSRKARHRNVRERSERADRTASTGPASSQRCPRLHPSVDPCHRCQSLDDARSRHEHLPRGRRAPRRHRPRSRRRVAPRAPSPRHRADSRRSPQSPSRTTTRDHAPGARALATRSAHPSSATGTRLSRRRGRDARARARRRLVRARGLAHAGPRRPTTSAGSRPHRLALHGRPPHGGLHRRDPPPDGDLTTYLETVARVRDDAARAALAPGHGRLLAAPGAVASDVLDHRGAPRGLVLGALRTHGPSRASRPAPASPTPTSAPSGTSSRRPRAGPPARARRRRRATMLGDRYDPRPCSRLRPPSPSTARSSDVEHAAPCIRGTRRRRHVLRRSARRVRRTPRHGREVRERHGTALVAPGAERRLERDRAEQLDAQLVGEPRARRPAPNSS